VRRGALYDINFSRSGRGKARQTWHSRSFAGARGRASTETGIMWSGSGAEGALYSIGARW